MNTIDIILLICLVPAAVSGLFKGFISQAISLVSILLGIWASFKFAEVVCSYLVPILDISEPVVHIISFVLIFLAIAAALHLLKKVLLGIVKFAMLGWLDKILGLVLALLKCVIVLGVVIMIFNTLNTSFSLVSKETLDASILYNPLKDLSYDVFPYFKGLLMKQ